MTERRVPRAKLTPLRAREGARFRCVADGFCCGDIHFVGPLAEVDVARVETFLPESTHYDAERRRHLMKMVDGHCVFLRRDGRCSIHADHGFEAKPRLCRTYPFALTATPEGGRISTAHRCPCRTMGTRDLIDPREVARTLRGDDGRLRAQTEVGARIALAERTECSFATYRAMETTLLARLSAGEDVFSVLGVENALPRLGDRDWEGVAHAFIATGVDDTRAATAVRWFGTAIAAATLDGEVAGVDRPWKDAFERAQARSDIERTADSLYGDWLADEIWSLHWVGAWDFERARRDWQACLRMMSAITSGLTRAGHRADRAAAEAIMVVELASSMPLWVDVVRAIDLGS